MKICSIEEVVYGWMRAQKWLYLERWSIKTKIIVFLPYLGSPSMKFIEIYVHIHVGMGLILEGMLPGRSRIRWSSSLEGGNHIGSTKTHAYWSKICCRTNRVVEIVDGCICMEWSWAMTLCEFFLRSFSMRCELMMPRDPGCKPFNVVFFHWRKTASSV